MFDDIAVQYINICYLPNWVSGGSCILLRVSRRKQPNDFQDFERRVGGVILEFKIYIYTRMSTIVETAKLLCFGDSGLVIIG
jgi:hypothetical protein